MEFLRDVICGCGPGGSAGGATAALADDDAALRALPELDGTALLRGAPSKAPSMTVASSLLQLVHSLARHAARARHDCARFSACASLVELYLLHAEVRRADVEHDRLPHSSTQPSSAPPAARRGRAREMDVGGTRKDRLPSDTTRRKPSSAPPPLHAAVSRDT